MRKIILLLFLLSPALAHAQGMPAPNPCLQFFSATGQPLSGGFLYTYAAGTTTPIATYTDATLTIANSNPIILNAGGYPVNTTGGCGIWLNPSVSYKFVLQNANFIQQWSVDNITTSNVNSLLTQANTWTMLQTFAGGINVTGIMTLSTIVTGNINGTYYIDNVHYAATAAGINAADAQLGSNPGIINVTLPGSYCDATVNLSNGHTLSFTPGLYNINIAGADSSVANVTWGVVGTGSNQVTLQSCSGSNKDVITSQHFSTFTGGTNFYGTYHVKIRGLAIDGNKSTETAGFGIRLYGRAPWAEDILTQNCYQDGQWWEFGAAESDSGVGTQANGNSVTLESDYNGGNGITLSGANTVGSMNAANNIVAHNNGGWGLQMSYSLSAGQINSYNNTLGGCDIKGGSLIATNVECDTSNTTWGLLQESGAGSVYIASAVIAGGIPFESRTTSGGTIHGDISSSSSGNPCIKINGGGALVIDAVGFSCSGEIVAFTLENVPSNISFLYSGTTTAYTGTPTGHDFINIYVTGSGEYWQFPSAVVNQGGFALTLPSINGTLATLGGDGISSGSITLSGGTGTHSFTIPYTTAPACTAADGTAANAAKIVSTTGGVTVTGTSTDVVTWICAPASNN